MSETKTIIQMRRGNESELPAETAEGEPLFCLDSHRLFVGMGPGDAPVAVDADAASIGGVPVDQTPPQDGQILIFDQGTGEYVPADPIVSGPDAPGSAPTKPPVQIGIVDDTGKVQRVTGTADGAVNVAVSGSGGGGVAITADELPLPDGAATEAGLGTDGATPPTIAGTGIRGWLRALYDLFVAGITVTGAVDVSGSTGVDVSGSTVSVGNFPASQRVNATSWPLPTGAATETSLGTDGTSPPTISGTGIRGWLRAIYEKLAATLTVSGSVSVSNFPATQPISAASLPLPAGAATSALQTTGNTSLGSLDSKAPTQGQKVMASSTPVVIASDQSAVPTSVASLPLPAGAATSALQTTGNTSVASIDTKTPTVGQKAMAASSPVAIASDQSAVPSIASSETGTVYNGTTALTPKFKVIVASASGATTIVAAVTSKKIRVLKWDLVANAAVNVKWQSHVTPTDLTGLYYLAQNGGLVSGYCPVGHFETVAGEALDINLSGAIAVGGVLTYVEV